MLADVTFSTEGIGVIAALLLALCGTVTFLYRQVIAAKDAQLALKDAEKAEIKEQRDGYKKLVDGATTVLEEAALRHQKEHGIQPIPLIAPVVPEHNSPTSEKQQQAADFATAQARVVAATLAMKVKPVEPPPLGSEAAKLVDIHDKAQEIKDITEELVPNHRDSPEAAVRKKVDDALGRTSPDETDPRRTPPDKTGET